MTEAQRRSDKRTFRSKLRRQRGRRRMRLCTVFDQEKYEEVKAKCLRLAKTTENRPAPRYNPLPNVERLEQLFIADFEAGTLTARIARPNRPQGALVGNDCGREYLVCYVDGVPYRVHRLLWKMKFGTDPDGQLDHRDGDRQNNAIANLRDVTPLENNRNRCRKSTHSASGRLGVSKCSATGLWLADIGLNNRNIRLGKYGTMADAIAARECGERYLYGMIAEHKEAA